MGWDAYSEGKNKKLALNSFRKLSDEIIKKTGGVDAYFFEGELDVSTSARMLEKGTGQNVYGDCWTAEQVKDYNENANWDFEYEEDDAWAYWSAREFLKICAQYNLSIKFSY